MEQQPHTPEQEAEIEAQTAELIWQRKRVDVDMHAASPRLREVVPSARRDVSNDAYDETLTIDVSGIVETLRSLPDGAGTAAFVEAYGARLHGT
jgi:hypothetical protein